MSQKVEQISNYWNPNQEIENDTEKVIGILSDLLNKNSELLNKIKDKILKAKREEIKDIKNFIDIYNCSNVIIDILEKYFTTKEEIEKLPNELKELLDKKIKESKKENMEMSVLVIPYLAFEFLEANKIIKHFKNSTSFHDFFNKYWNNTSRWFSEINNLSKIHKKDTFAKTLNIVVSYFLDTTK